MLNRYLFFMVCITTIAIASVSKSSAVSYQIHNLGSIDENYCVSPLDINNKGEFVGVGYVPVHNGTGYYQHAFYWSQSTGMVDLSPTDSEAYSIGISMNGKIVGGRWNGDNYRAATWTPSGNMSLLPLLDGFNESSAVDVTADGDVLGYLSNVVVETLSDGSLYRFTSHSTNVIWHPDGTIENLATSLPDHADWTMRNINNNGWLIGSPDFSGYYGRMIKQDGQVVVLPPIQGAGCPISIVYDLNDAGYAVGDTENHNHNTIAAKWDANGNLELLNPLSGCYNSVALGINNAGVVVGQSMGPGGRATYWDVDGAAHDLGALEECNGGLARAINDNGWIVGVSGQYTVLWTPVPEPGSVISLLCGLMGIVIMRKCRN